MKMTMKEELNQYHREASQAILDEDYELAEKKYHLLSHLSRLLYNESDNIYDRNEYRSLANEYANKESYARKMKKERIALQGVESDVSFSRFVGEDKVKAYLKEDVITPWFDNSLKDRKKNGLLIHGPYGVGKTILVKALANELGASIYSLSPLTDFSNDNYPDAINSVSRVVNAAVENNNSIVFLEDPVCYFPKGDEESISREISELFLDYFKKEMRRTKRKNNKVLFIATTDCPDKLDERIIHERVFDDVLSLSLPDSDTRNALIKMKLPELDEKTFNEFVSLTEGYTSWQITKFCSELKEKNALSIEDIKNLIDHSVKECDDGYFENLDEFLREIRQQEKVAAGHLLKLFFVELVSKEKVLEEKNPDQVDIG